MKKVQDEQGDKSQNNVKLLRMKACLTQQALAEAGGISVRHLQRIENGEFDINNVTLEIGMRLAERLGVKLEDLV